MVEIHQIAERLGGESVLGSEITSALQFHELVDKGFDPKVTDAMVKGQVVSRQELGQLAIAPRTLARRRQRHEKLTAEESDRLARITRVVTYAEEVFADKALAAGWLRESNRALGGRIPLEMAVTETGARLVEVVLDRIAFGDHS